MKVLQYIILGIMFLFSGGVVLQAKTMDEVILAGGCFWCMESDFQGVAGVADVVSGYTGGNGEHPTYHNYVKKGHVEVVRVRYDSSIITFKSLLDIYWLHIDPTDPNGQFCDRGHAYSTAIFYHSTAQKQVAETSKYKLNQSGKLKKEVVTNIIPATTFYPAEDYHQEYYQKNPLRYKFYRFNCGRDKRLKELWGDGTMLRHNNNDASLKEQLTPLQYDVTQNNGTEPPFQNEYWDNKKEGIYVDRISGEVLFSSLDKYRSGTGWPSFTKPLELDNIVEKKDKGWLHTRTEIRSKHGKAHLGHVFNDGPAPTGLRYCMNSAALRFIPKDDLKKEGYQKYQSIFEQRQ